MVVKKKPIEDKYIKYKREETPPRLLIELSSRSELIDLQNLLGWGSRQRFLYSFISTLLAILRDPEKRITLLGKFEALRMIDYTLFDSVQAEQVLKTIKESK